ncbi:MAG: FHA domain-containing protein [Oscillospiraceae bacterium]
MPQLDPEVSRNMHCILTFDPASEAFYLQAGDGRGLTYLNGTLLLTPMQLKPQRSDPRRRDDASFVPLCGESFHWNTYFQMP